ncbi:predicted protein [Postia placenta Mad-698-R]|uniref:G domain-containing protein n=1 Tax=Postia placenta MAD-698-R-SB12 TaxID=670580 RepID=A0A1X6MNB8_9APHY|nr:hypothetical protein POSPLADRAFT_1049948 [Postia placenta MAD-698-R-SB12]EED77409.1 predicted protein [Postia placenta Mad-698-R]OSX57749.1 hypothetical protein POSPLADRAFT_1049948 [Postia placenta MAD-698-R-SB12]
MMVLVATALRCADLRRPPGWKVGFEARLLGPTGTGKTSIINQLSGSSLVVSDNPGSLEPVTTAVQEASCEIDGRPVLLIDTPGLDAEEGLRSVVGIIADLRNRQNSGMKFSGIIYTCSVNENRVRPVNVFDAFRKLCGDAAMPVVTVVTTGWDHLRDRSVGEKREQELRSEKHGFRPALDRGAKIKQWDAKNPQTAEAIVKEILQSGGGPERSQVRLFHDTFVSPVTVLVGQFDYIRDDAVEITAVTWHKVDLPQLYWLEGKLYFYQLCPVLPPQHLNLCSFCIHMYSPRQSYGSPPPELSNNPFIDHPANALSRFPDISAGADTANSGQYTSWLQQPGQSGSMLASNSTGYPGQSDSSMYGGGAYQQPQPTGWHASPGYFQPQRAYGAPPMQPQTTGRPGFQPSSSFGQQLAAQVNTAYTGVPQQQPQYTGYPQMQAPSQFGAGYQPGYASQQPQQNPQYIAELDPYGPGSQPSYSGSGAIGYRPPHPREYVQQHKAELETWDSYSWKQIQNSFDALKEAWGARKRDIENRARSLGGAGLFGGGGYGGMYGGQAQELARLEGLVREAESNFDSVAASAFQMHEVYTGYRQSGDIASKRRVREAINAALVSLPDWPPQAF